MVYRLSIVLRAVFYIALLCSRDVFYAKATPQERKAKCQYNSWQLVPCGFLWDFIRPSRQVVSASLVSTHFNPSPESHGELLTVFLLESCCRCFPNIGCEYRFVFFCILKCKVLMWMEFKLDVSVLQKRSRLQIFGNQTCLLRRGVFVHRRCKDWHNCHNVHTSCPLL